jgi:hypothetical protein
VDLARNSKPLDRMKRSRGRAAIHRARINKPDTFIDGSTHQLTYIMHENTNSRISQTSCAIDWRQAGKILAGVYRESIALRPIFAELMGNSLVVGMYLSRAHYWKDKGKDPDGWVYKTCEEFQAETFLSRRQQDKAREILKTKPWWEEKIARVGTTPKFHYRIDSDLLDEEVINLILSKSDDKLTNSDAIASDKSDLIASDKSDLIASDKSDSIAAIAYTRSTYSRSTNSTSTNSISLTAKAEFGELELRNSEQANLPEQSSLQLIVPSQPLAPSGENSPPRPPRSTNPDKMPWGDRYDRKQAHRERAASGSHFEIGLKNKRWKDRADFDKFVAYARTWAKNRQEDVQFNLDNTKYGDGYINTILSRTASARNENDANLICWKMWNTELPLPPFVDEPAPPVEPSEPLDPEFIAEIYARLAKLKEPLPQVEKRGLDRWKANSSAPISATEFFRSRSQAAESLSSKTQGDDLCA